MATVNNFAGIDNMLVLALTPVPARAALRVILMLDARCAGLGLREPLLADIKRAWWREQLEALDSGLVASEPVLQAVVAILGNGVTGVLLSGLADRELRAPVLDEIMTLVCGPRSRALRLMRALRADDAARLALGRPLASPARRTLLAARIALLGR